jgi:hypothetical protein
MRMLAPLLGTLLLLDIAQSPSADQVRDRLDAYLLQYESELSALIATETLNQRVDTLRDARFRLLDPGAERKLVSEVAFVGLPGGDGLLGFRRVVHLDDRPVDAPGASIMELLRSQTPGEVTRQLLEQSAIHNLGARRTTNFPSVPLELLHSRYRARFTHAVKGRERLAGTAVTIMVAQETASPSIIRTTDHRDAPTRVTAWIDDRGRLWRADVRLRGGAATGTFEPTVRVEFRPHASLGILVPSEMRETFWSEVHRRSGIGIARYSEFHRFETSARILPPPP